MGPAARRRKKEAAAAAKAVKQADELFKVRLAELQQFKAYREKVTLSGKVAKCKNERIHMIPVLTSDSPAL